VIGGPPLHAAVLAAKQAAAAGAHRQAVALYAHALRIASTAGERAELQEHLAWTHFHGNDRHGAVAAGEEAVRLRAELGDPVPLGKALSTLALQLWSILRIDDALAAAGRAVDTLRDAGDIPALAYALCCRAVVLVNLDQEVEGLVCADESLTLDVEQLRPLGLIYRGRARWQLGDPDGRADIDAGVALAERIDRLDDVLLGHVNLAELLWRYARHDELRGEITLTRGYVDGTEHETHLRVESFDARLKALHGRWAEADAELRWGLDGDGGGMVGRHALPTPAQLAVRTGSPEAPELLETAWSNAVAAHALPAQVVVASAAAEQGWLIGDAALGAHARALLPRTEGPGRERERGELSRWLRRLGEPVADFPGCPPEYSAGLRGDRSAAAAVWQEIGAPYERALELVESGEPAAALEGLAVLDDLGARPAAAWARARLRALGVDRVPRGPQQTTRANPAGLTGRQLEILQLVADGLTNAVIAARLVLSVRTVDHHVSAVLQKLGVASRRDASKALAAPAG